MKQIFRKLIFLIVVVIVIMTLASCGKKESAGASDKKIFRYKNPNIQLEFRDTHIVPDNGKFYAVGTCEPVWGGKNPGVKLYVSDDLINWSFVKLLIDANELPADVWYKDRFWAPELRKIQGRYYLTFNCQNNSGDYGDTSTMKHYHACGLAVADTIEGPYSVLTPDEPLTPFASNDISLFEDEDGKTYAFFNNGWTDLHHIYVAEIDLAEGKLKEEPVKLISQEPGKWDGSGIEGSHVVKHEGVYYLFYSSWTKGYAVGYATATNIRGPWTKYENNPLFGAFRDGEGKGYLFKDGKEIQDPNSPYVTVGHNQVFIGPDGRYWTSYHGYIVGRSEACMVMDPFWFEDGKIKIDSPTYTSVEVKITPNMLKAFPGLAQGKQVSNKK